jgi:hypothetical protein
MQTRFLDTDTAKRLYSQLPKKICPLCGTLLPHFMKIWPHPDGWKIPGLDGRYWIYAECVNMRCKHQVSLNKLGLTPGDVKYCSACGDVLFFEPNSKAQVFMCGCLKEAHDVLSGINPDDWSPIVEKYKRFVEMVKQTQNPPITLHDH